MAACWGTCVTVEEINVIVNSKSKSTFENTTLALDNVGDKLDRITSIFFNLNSAETNDEIQKIAQEMQIHYRNGT